MTEEFRASPGYPKHLVRRAAVDRAVRVGREILTVTAECVSAPGRRYALAQTWDALPVLPWVMLNPSSATEAGDDATVRVIREVSFRHGFGGFRVANLFSRVCTASAELWAGRTPPLGPQDDAFLGEVLPATGPVAVAWGDAGGPRARARRDEVLRRLREGEFPLLCLGVNLSGEPRHPCRMSPRTRLVAYPGSGG